MGSISQGRERPWLCCLHRKGPGLVSGPAGTHRCPFSASVNDTLALVPSVLQKPKACLLQCRLTCFFYKCSGITIDFLAEGFEILSLGLMRFPCCSNNALSFLIYPVSDTIFISSFQGVASAQPQGWCLGCWGWQPWLCHPLTLLLPYNIFSLRNPPLGHPHAREPEVVCRRH